MTRLVEILSDRLEWPVDASTGEETRLGEEGLGLDSLMVVEFALDIEEDFGLELNEDEMLELAGMSLREVADFVARRAAHKAP
jgi:acyl carrier protein